MPEQEYIVDGQYQFSDEEVYLNDMKIADMVGKNKDEIFDLLGDDYEIVYGWADGPDREGYEYSNRGIKIFFGEESGIVESITCGEKATINGIRIGMDFAETQNILGDGILNDYGDNYQYQFILSYRYKDYGVHFSLSDENGYVTEMKISCFSTW